MSPRPLDYLLATAGALGISTAPVLVALSGAEPAPAAFWRFAYGLPVLLAFSLARTAGRRAWRARGWLPFAALAGVFFSSDLILWHNSIALIGAGPSTLLANTQVVWLALFGLLFLGERPSFAFWAALPLLALGLLLLSGGGLAGIPLQEDRLGLAFGLGAGFFYAATLICLRRARRTESALPETVLIAQLAVGLPFVAAVGVAEGSLPTTLQAWQHGWLLLLGVGVQAVSWFSIAAGLKCLPGHHAGLLLLAQPVSSFLLGWIVLDQALPAVRLLGAGLIVGGVAATLLAEQRGARRRRA